MTEAGSDDFTFDHFGNTTGITGKEAFTYNFDNCMTERENLLTDSVDNHEYDGDMRRMRSKLTNAANWTNFIHDELTENLLCEYTLVSGTYTVKALNTYGMGLISSNRQSTIRYFHFDGLGTTYHLTDTSQNVTDSYTYNAFGVPLSASGSSVNPYRYVGQWGYYDDGAMGSSSEMLLLGVRYYWPQFGLFSTWDPIPRLTTKYRYAVNSPFNLIDPQGKDCESPPIFGLPGTGYLCIDCSCAKKIGVWVILEGTHEVAIPAECDTWYKADGYVLGGVTWKIQGSSWVTISCQSNQQGGLQIDTRASQRRIFNDLGRDCKPYKVDYGEFGGGGKEPRPGTKPPYVVRPR
jgi:RHS repeat-associated protein